jgi:hypothetical protein
MAAACRPSPHFDWHRSEQRVEQPGNFDIHDFSLEIGYLDDEFGCRLESLTCLNLGANCRMSRTLLLTMRSHVRWALSS